jgi:hypothetical protein
VPAWFCHSNEFKVVDDNSHASSHYSAPKRRQRSRLKITDGGLGTRLDLELRIEASAYGPTVALFETKLNLVLLTSWVSYLDH